MARYVCQVCGHVYDEEKEGVKWDDLPDDWTCPVCDSEKELYIKEE
ncbi:MAG: rubredoxin [bacterium]|nr:rubredoxin [bacterium]